MTYQKYTSTGTLPAPPVPSIPFVSLQGNNSLKFFTDSFADIGIYKFQLTLSDTHLSSNKDLWVEFYNNPPFFIKEVPRNLSIKFNNTFEFELPPFMDEEGNSITVLLSGVPPIKDFIILVDQYKIVINPNQWNQVGSFKLNISLSDSQKINSYFFNVTIFNTAPYFSFGMKPEN